METNTPNNRYTLSLLAGTSGTPGAPAAANTKFNKPMGLAFDASGCLLVADSGNFVVQKLVLNAGTLVSASVVAGVAGQQYNGAPSTANCLWGPRAVAVDSKGGLYIADAYVDLVRYVNGGVMTTIAGGANPKNTVASYNGSATGANLLGVSGIAVDSTGIVDSAKIVYTTEWNNNAVRILTH